MGIGIESNKRAATPPIIPLSSEMRATIRSRTEARARIIDEVVGKMDALITSRCDKKSDWTDPAGVPGLMGLHDLLGLCFERQTFCKDRLPTIADPNAHYDRYRVYIIRPIWRLIFGVFCLRDQAGKPRSNESIVETFWDEEVERVLKTVRLSAQELNEEDMALLATASRLGVSTKADIPAQE